MSVSHDRNLPIVRSHVQQMGYGWAHTEVQLGRSGETPDVWALAEQPVSGYLLDGRTEIHLPVNMTSVHEFKFSVSDLLKDYDKPWRRVRDDNGRLVRALGEHRFYWFHAHGDVRPEHVDEDRARGWGIVVFDESRYEVVKVPARMACSYWDTIGLARELKDKEKHEQYANLMQSTARVSSFAHRESSPAATMSAPKGRVDPLDLIEKYLADGPATTAMLKRHLFDDHGIECKGKKLTTDMVKSRRFTQTSVGGDWSIAGKESAA